MAVPLPPDLVHRIHAARRLVLTWKLPARPPLSPTLEMPMEFTYVAVSSYSSYRTEVANHGLGN